MQLISIFNTHLTGHRVQTSQKHCCCCRCSVQSVHTWVINPAFYSLLTVEMPRRAAGCLVSMKPFMWCAIMRLHAPSNPSAEVPYITLNPRHRQNKGSVVWMDECVSWIVSPRSAPPLLVYLFWSNEGNKLCCCWCCWLSWLLSSVCKESVSALKNTQEKRNI